MLNKEELASLLTLLTERGTFTLTGKEMEGFAFIKNRLVEEFNKLVSNNVPTPEPQPEPEVPTTTE